MFLRKNHAKFTTHIVLVILSFILTTNNVVVGHTIKIDKNVGATLHIEPNDTPTAGEVSQVWLALTRQGGKVIPLEDCNCQLSIYNEPHNNQKTPLLQPTLKPIQAERYEGIPGADVTFPKPGNYLLQLTGKPIKSGDFEYFNLHFSVTVATGKSVNITNTKPSINPNIKANTKQLLDNIIEPQESPSIIGLLSSLLVGIFIILGIVLFMMQADKRG
ncbi:hypothetical protein H6F32_02945 [Anabaena sp. FACHB-1237]|uniref:hypothetical protein n=1 Tax=Anabaena sp. FACHB-1237 TaxID=2692769 RepID=UPI00168193D2|nr:hypothetical protein [Anabaena sp. FACHB-1237]MBD2136565.1 hypothetical protein [Anabaena sp. FACHB-1237]